MSGPHRVTIRCRRCGREFASIDAVDTHSCGGTGNDDDPLGPQLAECAVCGAVGLPERIDDHDCQAFDEDRLVADGGVEYPDTASGDQASLVGYATDQATLDDAIDDDETCLCDTTDLGCFDHFEVNSDG